MVAYSTTVDNSIINKHVISSGGFLQAAYGSSLRPYQLSVKQRFEQSAQENWVYKVDNGVWFKAADLLHPRRAHTCIVIGNQLYVFGGFRP